MKNSAAVVDGGAADISHYRDNCYSERHVPPAAGKRIASCSSSADAAVNTDLLLTPEEELVLRALDERATYWLAAPPPSVAITKRIDNDDAAPSSTSGDLIECERRGDLAAVKSWRVDTSILRPVADPPFCPEVPIRILLDALWCIRHRPALLKENEVKRQRAALIAAKRLRRQLAAAATATTSGSVSGLTADALGQRLSPTSTSLSVTDGTLSPSDTASFAGSSSPFALYLSSNAAAIPTDDDVPETFPLESVRDAFDNAGLTNVSLRSIPPPPPGGRSDRSKTFGAVDRSPVLSSSYFGREFVCRCVLDLIPLCPNVSHVSLSAHHLTAETIEHFLLAILDQPTPATMHPSLSSVDLRGNVIEVPMAKALIRIARSNTRLTSIVVDDGCHLLKTTRRRLREAVDANAQCMRTVSQLRSEWTQTTLLPNVLPLDITEYVWSALKTRHAA